MAPGVPKQNRRCTVYSWCTGHTGPRDVEHHSRLRRVPARGGRELRVGLTAVGSEPVSVTVEVVLEEGGLPMHVVELDPAEVLQVAAALRALALEGHEHAGR